MQHLVFTDRRAGVYSGGCGTIGEFCTTDGDCCSASCVGGRCSKNVGTGSLKGDVCFRASECCTGICNQTLGVVAGACG